MPTYKAVITIPIIIVTFISIALSLYATQSYASENIEIMSSYVIWHTSPIKYTISTNEGIAQEIELSNFWEVTITIKSTGTTPAEITGIIINKKEIGNYGASIICLVKVEDKPACSFQNTVINPGENAKLILLIKFKESGLSHGEIIEIRFYTQSKAKSAIICLP
ncbi:MAG: hypothetical protein NDF55_05295 [archaeon GB-1867-005]|nr:hypothetical protein [Candidatus Culexmicrobium cathedralense]